MIDDFLFVNKYAPNTIEECILSSEIKKTFISYRDSEKIPNLILSNKSPNFARTRKTFTMLGKIVRQITSY